MIGGLGHLTHPNWQANPPSPSDSRCWFFAARVEARAASRHLRRWLEL